MRTPSADLPEVTPDRRDLLKASGVAAAGALAASLPATSAAAQTPKVEAQEHWVMKGDVKLYVYRKQMAGAVRDGAKPILFLVHGSTFASRGSYDLMVPGRTGHSAMDHFAQLGYDVWTMDHEGYGFSARTADHAGIRTGVADLKAAMPLIEKITGKTSLLMFGESSGAIRAGVFAQEEPARVERLILHAFTYTGQNAPEIERRRKQADFYKANPRRPFGMANVENIFNRDIAGKADPAVIKALAEFEMQFGNSVPSGTYLDMAINMPMVDPTKLKCAVCLIRPEHDGNASEAELFEFFQKLSAHEKQFLFVDGMTHGGGMVGSQRQRLWHLVHSFMSCPPAPAA
jgi:alpha-beta hydrolase superfamily lysophospholipase